MNLGIILVALAGAFFALHVNFSASISALYMSAIIFGALMYSYKYGNIELEWKKGKEWLALLWGVGAYIVFTLGSTLLLGILKLPNTMGSIMKNLVATTPVFATSKFFNFITFGLFIPIAETVIIFVIFYEFIADRWRVTLKEKFSNPKLWIILIFIVLFFIFLHLSVKGVENVAALTLVGLMALTSLILVTIFEDARQATYFHILCNSIALLASYGLFKFI